VTKRQKAARKGAITRAINRAALKRYEEVERPATLRLEALLNHMLKNSAAISLRWNPTKDVGVKLKNGAGYGTLIRFLDGGRVWRVLPEGYKTPKDFHPSFWEPLL
jgi:hypothetical protein